MNQLKKIGEISTEYGITSRTLRYYEEVGLIESVRIGEARYRAYDDKAIQRIQQILLLRKLQLSVKDIQTIFSTEDMRVLISIFHEKLNNIDKDINSLKTFQWIIQEFLRLLKEKGYSRANGLNLLVEKSQEIENRHDHVIESDSKKRLKEDYMEEINMAIDKISKLDDVRIINLKPMRVAFYNHISDEPEEHAWNEMIKWVKEQELDECFTTRYFGFDSTMPKEGSSEYGYEVWVTVGEDVKPSGKIRIKEFKGGLYAVSNTKGCPGDKIPLVYKNLHEWIKESEYGFGKHQCLEEHFPNIPSKQKDEFFGHIDICIPISEKE
ncbi:MerR family transcriptional regulator [Oceanirhabdus sp. W0125-5]|uniref:MerR family transcriptional regulator n=1 Tax=Oceanirhabdus sp. W0125-5 TaxID=2999116 RepID=UPI0022F2D59F|nr:GyrI-like domain-containing protein [Oceanirhabdus sp. W0125-5]WBW98130.1 GyrI-like domain-containing protein [Oceanirhabdus sp. W0125-5]